MKRLCAALALLGALGAHPAWEEVADEDDWEREVVRGHALMSTVARVTGVVVQDRPFRPRYAVHLSVDGLPSAGWWARACRRTDIAFIEPGDGDLADAADDDLAFELLDNAKLAYATGRPVLVVVDPGDVERSVSGCKRPRIVRLNLIEPRRASDDAGGGGAEQEH